MINLSLVSQCSSVTTLTQLKGEMLFCTDTRTYKHPAAFVAIPGQKTNPLDVSQSLLSLGCPYYFYQKNSENDEKIKHLSLAHPQTQFIGVTDSVSFLQELATIHIKDWKKKSSQRKVFVISGSNGKTTHKEMLHFVLREVLGDKIVATEKNNNNHLGVPLTLMRVQDTTELVVLELGSNHPGEIKVLCDIASPDAGITTNIGATHLEFFGNEENVFQEESYPFEAIKQETNGKGLFLINQDDKFLCTLSPTVGSICYGMSPSAQAKIEILPLGAKLDYKGLEYRVENKNVTGNHNKLNLITVVFIAGLLYPEHKKAFEMAAENFQPTKNRSQWVSFENCSVFLDAYNANPSSMKAALEGFKESVVSQGLSLLQACVVLGDMNELGDSAPRYHKEIAQFVAELGFKNVFFVGRYAGDYLSGLPTGHPKRSTSDFKQEYRQECLKKFPIHFIKGSRSLQLESLFDIT